MTLTVSPQLEEKLVAVAGSRDLQTVFEEMVAASVAHEERIIAGIRRGIQAAERGEGAPHDDVFAKLEKKLLDEYGVRV